MADDDDDDSFGEFTFASNQTTPISSSQIPVTTGDDDDDDWGDFSFYGNNTTDHNLKSPQSEPQPQTPTQTPPKWEKIQGALPLSFFGGEEEREDEDKKPVTPLAGDGVKPSSFPNNSGFPSNNNSDKSNSHLGINDLIANLYSARQQQQLAEKAADNGNGLDSTATRSTVSKDLNSKSESLSSFSFQSVDDSGHHGSDDESGWEFMDANSESKLPQNGKDNKERSETTVSPLSLQGAPTPSQSQNNGFFNGPTDVHGAPNNGFFDESHVTDSGLNSMPITNIQNGFSADIKADSKDELNSNLPGGTDDRDDSFGDFETAFMEQPSKKKEVSEETNFPLDLHDASNKEDDIFSFPNGLNGDSHNDNNGFDFRQSPVSQNTVPSDPFTPTDWTKNNATNSRKFEVSIQEPESKPQGYEPSPKNYKEPVPLSIFGIEEEPEVDNSFNLQHELFKSPSSAHVKHMRTHSSNLSINDILFDLYSQSEPVSSKAVDDVDDGNFDDGSWEFKDASTPSKPQNQNSSFKEKLNNFIDLYSNLKDELCIVARHHLYCLKKAKSTAALAGEDMKVADLDKEIQEVIEKLHQKDIKIEDDDVEQVISLKQYIETFHEPHFLKIDSEYNISRRLPLAESDLQTAIDLINHITTVLKIITLAPKGNPCNYVTEWLKIVSVCSQELKHGTWIWNQSLQKNVHNQILSQQQGKQFVNALGEIYRAVVIIQTAVKSYKPWILLNGENLEGLYGLLAECDSLWSTSGLEEVIPSEYLLKSITHIRNLDEFTVLNEEESRCQLSLLSPQVVPEMKMVRWNGDTYFVTLANLWANLISTDPPKLSIMT
ncbi:hypothetical protein LXL04_014201 [Taraxacum kok-saghyz]